MRLSAFVQPFQGSTTGRFIIRGLRLGQPSIRKLRFACIVFLLGATTIVQAQNFRTLVFFDGTNGSDPYNMTLIQGNDGDLYGTTLYGPGIQDTGTVFKVTPEGALTTLYGFCAQPNCSDGTNPTAGLVQATDGNFYGTTNEGGGQYGGGTIFKITAGGTLTTLYGFCAQPTCPDGANPGAPLMQARDGSLYGTTGGGGTYNDGTIFRITSAGELTTLHSFNSTDGNSPLAGLIQGTDGNFYGITYGGGANNGGTVFELDAQGNFATLYNFCTQPKCADGANSFGSLIQGPGGNFYGTTSNEGAYLAGTVFKLTPNGVLTTLYSFCPHVPCTDGSSPWAGLLQGTDGYLYGTTSNGPGTDDNQGGTIFRIHPQGGLTTVYRFGENDGDLPWGSMVETSDGLYGVTLLGPGADGGGGGTIFTLSHSSGEALAGGNNR